ncbi:MAG: SNF2-related protein [Fusobacteriota bacterium]
MEFVNLLKGLIERKRYKRGKDYYNTKKIVKYDYGINKKGQVIINAAVKGSSIYLVDLAFSIDDQDIDIGDVSCTCPDNCFRFCKHSAAVLYKFLKEDFGEKYIQKRKKLIFEKLSKISKESKEEQKKELEYHVNGLTKNSRINFKIIIKSDSISEELGRILIDYIHNKSERDEILSYFDYKELANINILKNLQKKESQTENAILIYKNKDSFNFLMKLAQEKKLYFSKTQEIAIPGEEITPELLIAGNEEKIKLEVLESEYNIFKANDNFSWTVIENEIHPIKMEKFEGLSQSIDIPEENLGEFLFEILPSLKRNYNVNIDSNLKGYELIQKEPEIKLNLDYRDEVIYCEPEVQIEDHKYVGTEIIKKKWNSNFYKRGKNKKVWIGWNTKSIKRLINFLEDHEFHVQTDKFTLKDQRAIQTFITDGIVYFPEDWEMAKSDSFKNIEVFEIELEPIIEFGEQDDKINWFEFNVKYSIGDRIYSKNELEKLLKKNKYGEEFLKVGERYYVLESNNREEKIKDLVKWADKTEEGNYKTNYYNLLYYRQLVKENGIKYKGNKLYNELDEDITTDNLMKKVDIPLEVKTTLRDYQKEGFYWLKFLERYYFGGILADDMGLGKTLQTLTLLKSVNRKKPSLIICPRTLIYNWGEEIRKFFPEMKFIVYYGTPDERIKMQESFYENDIIITSYSTGSRDVDDLNKYEFLYCILDEAHHIKNRRTKRAKGVKKIKADHKLALTGTPLENSLEELWSIFDFIMPGYLDKFSRFNKKYLNPINKENNKQKLNELKKRISFFVLRRKKEDVLKDLPEKLLNIHKVEMTKVQEDSYQMILDEVKSDLTDIVSKKGFNKSRINILAALTKLRQICNHPQLILKDISKKMTSGKLEALLEIVEDAIASGHKIIVFSQFVKMLKIIRKEFLSKEIKFKYLDGGTRNRMEKVNEFNSDENLKVFLISLKAGGTGINLTSADIVIHVDPWWNPMVERQATDRAHRIGQKNQVTIYKLITAGTIEEKMLKLQKKKQDIFDNVIESNESKIDKINWEDIQELLEYN